MSVESTERKPGNLADFLAANEPNRFSLTETGMVVSGRNRIFKRAAEYIYAAVTSGSAGFGLAYLIFSMQGVGPDHALILSGATAAISAAVTVYGLSRS